MEQSVADLNVNDLVVFARVAELGSFSRAAAKTGLPKSTVSRRLAALEQLLGERLLLRTTRRQTLTEFGNLLLEHARQVVAEVEAIAALREGRQAEPSGRLRVSMPSDIANLVLADALAAFVAAYPGISLELDLSARRVDLLSEGFDVALRMGDLPSESLLAARRLHTLSSSLYASPDYIAQFGEPQKPEDLLEHRTVRILSRSGEPETWILRQGDQRWEGRPGWRVTANSPEILLRLARAGVGIASLPDFSAAADVQRGSLRRLLSAWTLPGATAWAVFPGRKLMPSKTRVFVDMLHGAFNAA